jgi:DNA mismatch repair protein MutL
MLNRGSLNFNIMAQKEIFLKHKYRKSDKMKFRQINSKTLNKNFIISDLKDFKIVGQFDKKFLVLIHSQKRNIIIFDQHAVHERILFEFYSRLLLKGVGLTPQKFDSDANLTKFNMYEFIFTKFSLKDPISFTLNFNQDENVEFLNKFTKFDLSKINSLYFFDFIYNNKVIKLFTVPLVFEKLLYIDQYESIFKNIVLNLNRLQICPNAILDCFSEIIKMRACKDAIKFNEELDNQIIETLVYNLKECENPFLCAHGRHNFYIIYKK